jgi:hypothetical protein
VIEKEGDGIHEGELAVGGRWEDGLRVGYERRSIFTLWHTGAPLEFFSATSCSLRPFSLPVNATPSISAAADDEIVW